MILSRLCIRLSLVCALPVAAAEADDPAKKPAPKPEPAAVVEVTAPLPTEPLVTVLDAKAPRQPVPAHDGAEYLKTIPGFSVIRKGGTDGDPVLRGMAGSRLIMLLDGEQILGGCGMRMDPPTAYIFPESYDRITVVKGPQTVLYGPGNSAGTVRFERSNARFQQPGFEGFASLMGGSFGRHDEVFDARVGTSDVYVRGIGTRSHSDDYEDGKGTSIHSKYTRWSANAAFGWTPNDNTLLEVTGARSNGEAAYADRTMDGAKFLRENLGLKGQFRHLSTLVEKVEFQAYRNYADHIMDNYSVRTFTPTMMSSQPSAMNPDRTTKGGRLAADLRVASTTLLELGFDAQTNEHTGRMSMMQWSMPEEAKPRVPDARFRNMGLFAEVNHAFTTQDRLVGGLRADRWHAEDPRATVALTMMSTVPNPTADQQRDETLTSGFLRYEREAGIGSTWYAGVGHAERFPDYWEAITKESRTGVSAFNTRPERTTQLDIGWIQQTGTVQASVSAFYGKVGDFILIESNVAKPAGMMGTRLTTVTRNVDATTWGGEVGATTKLAGFLKVDATLAYTHGQNDTDAKPLAQIAPLEARLGLGYEVDAWSVGLLLRGVARQDRFALNQGNIVGQDLGATGGFGIVSFHGGWKPAHGWLVSAGVDNLFNRLYAEHISRGTSVLPGYVVQSLRVNEPGRMAWLKASFTFGR
ncbi:TonB-dependent copper receptor [Geothrix sp. PMB-07]|uniref:TonB-dependent copper receptor n=1 Tax=Geothrix sp. PMB-07 TaxID=3068640 RepID=UPI0027409B31|nr:TonB-dependent copper receptor [Geothrix sp. PMB-07]WLT31916.1 TonB-dependent copper receptor [Geothrix sp. PMB-07]